MTYATANHLGRAIMLCTARCRQSSQPYVELASFIGALRAGGVRESYLRAISHAVLQDIASAMTGKGAASWYVVQ
jgi:hypothetical protein